MRNITYLPKLLAGILAAHSLEDLRAAGVLVDPGTHFVDAVVDDDVEARVDILVRRDLFCCE